MAGTFFAEDLEGIFDADEFAEVVTFDGSSTEVLGHLDQAADLSVLGSAEIGTTAPALTLPTASVPANVLGRYLRTGDLLAGAKRFRVSAVHHDGLGMSVLVLQDA